jgi:hypothetical protein
MNIEKSILNNFYVLEGTETGVTVTDGLMCYDVKISNNDITDILIKKFGITPKNMEDLLKHYELHEDEIIREHIKNNNWWDFKTYVQNFYSNIKDFNFIDFSNWTNSYHYDYDVCADVDDNNRIVFSLKEDCDNSLDGTQMCESLGTFRSAIENIKDEIEKLQKIQKDLSIHADYYRKKLLNTLNDNLKDNNLKPIPVKKYKDEIEVLNTIKELNANNYVEKFLKDYNQKHILSGDGVVCVDLVKDKDDNYWNTTYYNDTDDDDYIYKDDITFLDVDVAVSINYILATDDILYKPTLQECKEYQEK